MTALLSSYLAILAQHSGQSNESFKPLGSIVDLPHEFMLYEWPVKSQLDLFFLFKACEDSGIEIVAKLGSSFVANRGTLVSQR